MNSDRVILAILDVATGLAVISVGSVVIACIVGIIYALNMGIKGIAAVVVAALILGGCWLVGKMVRQL